MSDDEENVSPDDRDESYNGPISDSRPEPPPKPSEGRRQKESKEGTPVHFNRPDAQPPVFSTGRPSKLPKEKLMQSEGIIPVQSGTNKFDSQKGMTGFGTGRDVLDHSKCTNLKEMDEAHSSMCKEIIRLQSGSNKYASQKGHSAFGAVRDVNYHKTNSSTMSEIPEDLLRASDGIVRLQSGTNKLASQAGYTAFGAVRGVKPARFDNPEQSAESQGFVPLQMGTNKFASQAGMTGMGMPRLTQTKAVDEARPEIPNDESVLPKQSAGSSQGANQRGMAGFGAFRNNLILGLKNQDRKSQGSVPYQMGINWMDSQAGKTPFGHPRLTITHFIDDTRPELPEELSRNPNTPKWNKGSFGQDNQAGMTAMGMPRDVKGNYIRRLW